MSLLAVITTLSYLTCAIAHVLTMTLLLISRAQHRYKALLMVACFATTAWSLAASVQGGADTPVTWLPLLTTVLEQARSLSWMAVIVYILLVAYDRKVDPRTGWAFVAMVVASVAYVIWHQISIYVPLVGLAANQAALLAQVLIATAGLVMSENLFRNVGRETRWALKYLCFAVGGMFAFDFVLYAKSALFGRADEDLLVARGMIDAMMAPLIVMAAARSRKWPIDVHISREIVFHSATVMLAGAYLIGTAIVGYYLQILDTPWAPAARLVFVAAALLTFLSLATSSSVRANIKRFVSRNFFSNKHDYRQEWPRFIAAISDNLDEMSIPQRIVRAMANLLECTTGSLWGYVAEDTTYRQMAAWNISDIPPNITAQDPLIALLAGTPGIVDVSKRTIDGTKLTTTLPPWLTDHARVWVVVPLWHGKSLIGFVAMGRPRTPQELDWEDFELLKTAGRQAASYIAEDQSATALLRAQRFEDFNRQFAFVVHDIKNLAGQMSLILRNAERHGSNPKFQQDVLATVADSLSRMQALLDQLKQRRAAHTPITRLELATFLREFASKWHEQLQDFSISLPDHDVEIVADPQRITAVFNHLLQNAADAAGPEGSVRLKLASERPTATDAATANRSGWAVVEVSDNGAGMARDFIDNKLFKPFDSTKSTGFGIGAYQIRHMVGEMGGALSIDSTVGAGTRITIRLPLAPESGAGTADADPAQHDITAG